MQFMIFSRVWLSQKKRCRVKSVFVQSRLLRTIAAACFAVSVVSSIASEAGATWITNGTSFRVFTNNSAQQGANLLGTGSGGEFALQHVSGGVGNTAPILRSFCVETQNFLGNNETLTSNGLFDNSANGGNTLNQNPNPLVLATRALFFAFANIRGNTGLNGVNFGNAYAGGTSVVNYSTDSDANQLQDAIWQFQSQNGHPLNNANKFVAWYNANAAFLTSAPIAAILTSNVKVVRVLRADGSPGQDVLTIRPQGSTVIPEPASFALFACGLVGCCGFLRRRA